MTEVNTAVQMISEGLKMLVEESNANRSQCATSNVTTGDAGHATPVCSNYRWLLNNVMQTIENTLRRPRPGFRSAESNLAQTQEQMAALNRKYVDDQDGMLIDPTFNNIASWHIYNEGVVEGFSALQAELATVYQDAFGTPWTPYEVTSRGNATSAPVTEDVKKANAQLAMKLSA